jgi:hypothetical protein
MTADTDRVAHHETLARIAHQEAATYRSYLGFSTDPDQREWASRLARSCEIAAEAEEAFAAALEARGKAAATITDSGGVCVGAYEDM